MSDINSNTRIQEIRRELEKMPIKRQELSDRENNLRRELRELQTQPDCPEAFRARLHRALQEAYLAGKSGRGISYGADLNELVDLARLTFTPKPSPGLST